MVLKKIFILKIKMIAQFCVNNLYSIYIKFDTLIPKTAIYVSSNKN